MGVSLVKGQKINLAKEGGREPERIFMGLGWDAVKKKGFFSRQKNIDLDASCLLVDGQGNVVDAIYFGNLKSRDGSVLHTGDNLTGDGDGDDEVIAVNLAKVPANVETILFTVSSYQGQSFRDIENAFCRVVDEDTGEELAKYDISGGGDYTGLAMAKLYRHNGAWKFAALGDSTQAKTVRDFADRLHDFI